MKIHSYNRNQLSYVSQTQRIINFFTFNNTNYFRFSCELELKGEGWESKRGTMVHNSANIITL